MSWTPEQIWYYNGWNDAVHYESCYGFDASSSHVESLPKEAPRDAAYAQGWRDYTVSVLARCR